MVLEVLGSWVGVGLASLTFSSPTLLCVTSFFLLWHNSGTASMATAVSAGAATAGVRGGVWLCSCALTMATAVSAGSATAGCQRCRMAVLLCSHHGNSLSAGAATAGVRGGVWLCSCAVTMATA